MTVAQINTVLTENGYSFDKWIPFSEFGAIMYCHDTAQYINKKRNRIKFDKGNELLEICIGHELSDGTFEDSDGNMNNYSSTQSITFKEIVGFIQRCYFDGVIYQREKR